MTHDGPRDSVILDITERLQQRKEARRVSAPNHTTDNVVDFELLAQQLQGDEYDPTQD